VHRGWEDMNYHGDVEFVGCIAPDYPRFVARFTDGKLTYIARPETPKP
jgi:hypothetical protein